MAMPIFSTRLPPEHHDLFRRLAAKAKADPAFLEQLAALSNSVQQVEQPSGLDEDVADLRSRLERLENTVRHLSDSRAVEVPAVKQPSNMVIQPDPEPPVQQPSNDVKQRKRPSAADIAARAALIRERLAAGATKQEIADELGISLSQVNRTLRR